MARKSSHIAVLQFDARFIACLHVNRSAKGVEVVHAGQVRGDWKNAEADLVAALRDFAAQHELAAGPLYTVLPRHEMTARILYLPSHSDEEIARMVRLSAEEYVPYPLQELVIDQCVLERKNDGHSTVLAVFAHRDVVEAHLRLLGEAGLTPDQIYVSTACLASVASAARPEAAERWALVHLGSGGLEVLAFTQSTLAYNRGIASIQDWTFASGDATAAREELCLELRSSLGAYRRDSVDGLGVDTLYVATEWQDPQPACEALAQELSAACEPAPFGRALAGATEAAEGPLPLTLLGAALAAQDRAAVRISLVPGRLKKERASAVAKRTALRVGILCLLALVASGGAYYHALVQRQAYIAELEARLREIRPSAKNVIAKQRQLLVLQERLERTGGALELLARVTALAPEGVNISEYHYGYGQSIVLRGRALNTALVDTFADNLRKSDDEGAQAFFARTQTTNSVDQVENKRQVTFYEISIPFAVEEDSDDAPARDDDATGEGEEP